MATLLGLILADFTTSLATAIAVGGTTATLQSATDDDGIALPAGRYFFTLDGSNSNKEHLSCDLSSTALTNIKSVSRQGVESSGVARAHRIGTTVALTDFAHIKFINDLVAGTTTFNASVPLGYDGAPSITTGNQLATKTYVDGVAVAGAPNADTTTKGIVEEATQAEVDAKTQTGGTGAKLFQNLSTQRSTLLSDFVVDTGAANAYVITPAPAITAYTTGQQFTFKAVNANTTTSTINISGLGVKTIKKLGNTNLASGDIAASQLVEIEYDGTNFQMLQPVANAPATSAELTAAKVEIQKFTGNGTWTKATGAKIVDVYAWGGGGGGGSGARSAATAHNRDGGSGAAGGSYSYKRFLADALGATESVVVGAIGTGGAVKSSDGVGNAGTNGGFSAFGTTVVLKAPGGGQGLGGLQSGSAAGGTAAAGNGDVAVAGGTGGAGGDSADGNPGIDTESDVSARGGGSGSAATGASTFNGGAGGAFTTNYVKTGGAAGAASDGAGGNGAATDDDLLYGGVGGGGGASSNGSTTAGGGGVGGFPGGGGGGGGGAATTSGAGGNGALGQVIVISYF